MQNTSETWVYLNGEFMPRTQAVMDIEDRAAMFADGVYEVTHAYHGRPFALAAHLNRLHQSLAGIELSPPACIHELPSISTELIQRNAHAHGSIYWQVSRGPAIRKHVYPAQPQPTVLVMSYPGLPLDPRAPAPTARVLLCPDLRWERCCYKTLMLLPNAMAKNQAVRCGADEAILHRGSRITEGSSTNVLAVRQGALYTHPADHHILNGITRQWVLDLARELGIPVKEEAITLESLSQVDELILTGTTTQVTAVTHVNGQPLALAQPGPITRALHQAFVQRILKECPPAV